MIIKSSQILLFTFFICLQQYTMAQKRYIVLEKTLSNKQIKFQPGDKLKYKLEGENFFRTDRIISLNDTSIEFHYNQILYGEISKINIKGSRFTGIDYYNIGTYTQIAGIGYIAIDQFNRVVVMGQNADFNTQVWQAGGLIFLGGTILKILSPKKVKVGGKYRIRYMNLN